MKAQVTANGLLIPKQLLEGVHEVEIRKEKNLIFIIPIATDDPIFQLGESPIVNEIDDASEHHDRYIYQL